MTQERSVRGFYDDLAADYHLIYADWAASIDRQGASLDRLVRQLTGTGPRRILDCSSGVGTQLLGLAARGHYLVGSDLSPVAVARAAREAAARSFGVGTAAADMRALPFSADAFDAVLCADNSIAHLLTEADVLAALHEMRRVTRPHGVVLVGVRSDHVRQSHPTATPVQVCVTPQGRVVTLQLWRWHGDGERYDFDHIQLLPRGSTWEVRVRTATSWAMTRVQLTELATRAGLAGIEWHKPEETGFFQPLMTARVAANSRV